MVQISAAFSVAMATNNDIIDVFKRGCLTLFTDDK